MSSANRHPGRDNIDETDFRDTRKTGGRPRQISPDRLAWLEMSNHWIDLQASAETTSPWDKEREEGRETPHLGSDDLNWVMLSFRKNSAKNGAKPFRFELTSMTVLELETFFDFIRLAVDAARPVCERRDREAWEAWDEGDDSFVRIHKPEPRMIVRPKARPPRPE